MPLFWLSLAFLSGIVLAELLAWPASVWLVLAGVALAAEIFRRLWSRFLLHTCPSIAVSRLAQNRIVSSIAAAIAPLSLPLLVLSLALGGVRLQAARPQIGPEHIAWYNDRDDNLLLEGMVDGWPDVRDTYTLLEIESERLCLPDAADCTPVSGRLLARVPPVDDWRYGDRVRLDGLLSTPFENEEFSYRDFLARRDIHTTFSCGYCPTCSAQRADLCISLLERGQGNPILAAIYALRQRGVETVYRLFPDPEAALMAGILLGVESGIPEDVQQAFNDTGTSHIIAISGFNFAIVAGLFAALFGRLLGRWRGMLAAFLGIALYALLAGAGAGVIRAAIMGGLSVFAMRLGRRQNGLNSLAFVAALMALFDAYVLWDVSFQLSFMATLGLVQYADPLSQGFVQLASRRLPPAMVRRLAGPVGEYFLFTLAAQLTTLPVILYYFQRFSWVSLLANPLVLPPQPAIMILGGLATLAGMLYLPAGQLLAYLAWPFVLYTIRVVELLARLPSAAWTIAPLSLWALLLFYFLLFAWTAFGGRLRAWSAARLGSALPRLAWPSLTGAALLAVVVWQMVLAAPDGRLHLTMLDVGSGDALLIQTPGGRTVLVDGGPSPNTLSDALGRRLPVGRRQIDYLVVAASGEEQLAALPRTLERFSPSAVLWSGPTDGFSARGLRGWLTDARIPVTDMQPGQALDLGDGARLAVLAVTGRGSILLLEWGKFRALLPAGQDFDSLEALLEDGRVGPVTALMLAQCGTAQLNPPEWIARWRPQVVLLSVAADDRFGRPAPETIQALQGYTLLRTDRHGWIDLGTDGEQLWVMVERR